MTDKQIIIDEIDMSGCCHQGKDNTCTCPHYKKECGKNPNCHYKIMQRQTKKLDKFYKSELELKQKLFRKEQECERLKGDLQVLNENLKDYIEHFNKASDQLDQLKAENEELKEIIQRHDNDNNALLKEVEDELCEYYRRHRECLTEIKEIAEHCIKQDICTTCDNSDKCHIEDEEIPTYDVCKLILQKISEVENEN